MKIWIFGSSTFRSGRARVWNSDRVKKGWEPMRLLKCDVERCRTSAFLPFAKLFAAQRVFLPFRAGVSHLLKLARATWNGKRVTIRPHFESLQFERRRCLNCKFAGALSSCEHLSQVLLLNLSAFQLSILGLNRPCAGSHLFALVSPQTCLAGCRL